MNKAEEILPYQDTSLSFEERAADLVSRMTLEEKVAQLGYKAAGIERLGVAPYDYWKEALHGVARQGAATSFPTALSMSNTWNTELIYKLADATSTEARAKNDRYNLSYWSPTINMASDPRWGRNEESMGEDPYLTGQLGAAFVNGMQGNDTTYLKTIATLKHFAANNNEAKRSSGTSVMTEFNMRNYYTKAFQNITESSNPGSVMSSYNATTVSRNGEYIYNFIPSLSNSYLLKDLLRRAGDLRDMLQATAVPVNICLTTAPLKSECSEAINFLMNSISVRFISQVLTLNVISAAVTSLHYMVWLP